MWTAPRSQTTALGRGLFVHLQRIYVCLSTREHYVTMFKEHEQRSDVGRDVCFTCALLAGCISRRRIISPWMASEMLAMWVCTLTTAGRRRRRHGTRKGSCNLTRRAFPAGLMRSPNTSTQEVVSMF